jgi:hypothetical protein
LKRIISTVSALATRVIPQQYRPFIKGAAYSVLRSPLSGRGNTFGRFLKTAHAGTAPTESHHRNNPLRAYFESHLTGPGIWKWRHYFDVYHRHLSKFVGQQVNVLEIGIYSGGSLEMWRQYFGARCRMIGVDIEPACKVYANEQTSIFIGDQADRAFWALFKQDVPTLDVVIDDGGHQPEQQIISLEELLPHLRPGGVYICEDVHRTLNPFHAYVAGLSQHLHAVNLIRDEGGEAVSSANAVQAIVHSLHVYPYILVFERTDTPISELVLARRGTQWQPFL